MEISEDDLIGKPVMNTKGFLIGRIKQCVKDKTTGKDTFLLVEPAHRINLRIYTLDDQGNIVFPIEDLARVKNTLILE
jgi:sporulation protein YlmC with PRC-barrel domain